MNRGGLTELLRLVYRQGRKNILVHTAVAILFASAVTVLAMYTAYLNREAEIIAGKIPQMVPEGHILARSKTPQPVDKVKLADGALFIGAWDEAIVLSDIGSFPAVIFGDNSLAPILAKPAQAAIHQNLAMRYGLKEGDYVKASVDGISQVQIVFVYTDASFSQGFNFGERLLINTGVTTAARTFFYYRDLGRWSVDWTLSFIQNSLPDASLFTSRSELVDAGRIVSGNYSSAVQARLLFITFIFVAFLSAKLLTFLDQRQVLAILKAVGLKNAEVFAQVATEALLSPLCGMLIGWGVAKLTLAWLHRSGLGFSFTSGLVVEAMGALLPAIAVGVAVPARLAQVGSVIELSLERSLTLFRQTVGRLDERLPALDDLMGQGVQFVKVDTVYGKVDGFVFRKLGDHVRKGEVLATTSSWAGLKRKDVLAPTNGTIVFYQADTGYIGVSPDSDPRSAYEPGDVRLSVVPGGESN